MTNKEAFKMISDFAAQSDKYGVISEELFDAFQMAISALENSNSCKECECYAEYEGVCSNSDSPFNADYVEYPDIGCAHFQGKETTGEWIVNGPQCMEMYTCPHCDESFDTPFLFCPGCGKRLH